MYLRIRLVRVPPIGNTSIGAISHTGRFAQVAPAPFQNEPANDAIRRLYKIPPERFLNQLHASFFRRYGCR
jgi:hypothetical protein